MEKPNNGNMIIINPYNCLTEETRQTYIDKETMPDTYDVYKYIGCLDDRIFVILRHHELDADDCGNSHNGVRIPEDMLNLLNWCIKNNIHIINFDYEAPSDAYDYGYIPPKYVRDSLYIC